MVNKGFADEFVYVVRIPESNCNASLPLVVVKRVISLKHLYELSNDLCLANYRLYFSDVFYDLTYLNKCLRELHDDGVCYCCACDIMKLKEFGGNFYE